ncbi:gamma-butyrobetaine dioxygenase-like [Ptychodera flava]|uniref:gamma-butyrobetaine dioxygenase-like n=1 Tax=Ptychodera flava TaxID=63121 RepID=UPI00396A6777
MLLLEWNDGTVSRYPFVWLRDNCRCRACWHPDTESRIALTADLNVDIQPNGITVSDDGAKVDIHWPDNHLSPFATSMLHDVRFEDEVPKKNIRMWGSELLEQLPTFQFNEIMKDETKLLNFLEDLRDVGLTLLQNAPAETGHVAKLVDRISYLKITSHGYIHTIKSMAGINNLAYTGHKLGLHTDLPHYRFPPDLLVLHCIQQSKIGGESIFADGFKTALQLKEEDPEAFEILSNTHCDFMDKGVLMPVGEFG